GRGRWADVRGSDPRQSGPGPTPRPRTRCMTRETANRIRKTQNRILAIPIAAPATVVKPSTPAIRATTRKVKAQPSMSQSPNAGGDRLPAKQRPGGVAVPIRAFGYFLDLV